MKKLGLSIGARNAAQLADRAEAARKYLAPMGMDILIVQVDNNYQFQSTPELSEGDITAEALREAAKTVNDAGMEFIPMYNCIGHQGWKGRNSLLRLHPEFDETPDIADDKFFLPCRREDGKVDMLDVSPGWCMNEPRVFDYVLPALGELCEASSCKTLHVGMDEIFWFNQCPRCRDISPRQLFYQNFMRIHDFLAEKGVKTMLWADRLLDAKKLLHQDDPQRRWWDYDTYGAHECLPDIPEGVTACNWHYDLEKSYPSTGELIANGVSAFPSCWRSAEAAEALWTDSLRQARELGREDLLTGLLCTFWGQPVTSLCDMLSGKCGNDRETEFLETLRHAVKMLRG